MSKLRWPQETIPKIDDRDDSKDETDDMDLDSKDETDNMDLDKSNIDDGAMDNPEDDAKLSFKPGYIQEWWSHYMRLPPETRPVFVPKAGYRDTFQDLSESTLLGILWGGRNSDVNHPTKSIMERHIFSYDDATAAVKNNYGNLIFKLFVGNREDIRKDDTKQQTSYGKRTNTMETLCSEVPELNGPCLKQYVDQRFEYVKAWKNANASGSTISLSPPKLPSNQKPSMRYALSNRLSTDGIQVHVLAFDTRKGWTKQKHYMPSLEKRFPDRQTIRDELGAVEDIVVVGVDPGERVSASFCMLDPQAPKQVSNLSIKRTSLYSPSLAYRNRLEDIKRRKPVADNGDLAAYWTNPTTTSGTTELSSIKEVEQSLGDSSFTSLDHYHDNLEQFARTFKVLTGFYSSRTAKKLHWERTKSLQAEKDLAVNGAIRMIPVVNGKRRPALFLYGDGRFNTRTKLTTMHETFKYFFVMKVTIS
jgi:hypothetical protein